jgi:hypothetical protein
MCGIFDRDFIMAGVGQPRSLAFAENRRFPAASIYADTRTGLMPG